MKCGENNRHKWVRPRRRNRRKAARRGREISYCSSRSSICCRYAMTSTVTTPAASIAHPTAGRKGHPYDPRIQGVLTVQVKAQVVGSDHPHLPLPIHDRRQVAFPLRSAQELRLVPTTALMPQQFFLVLAILLMLHLVLHMFLLLLLLLLLLPLLHF